MSPASGKVYLVGAGPGDPGLLTVRGRELLERADSVVYDSLANEALLAHAPRAEKIFVGKRPDRHTLAQEDINRVLVEQARRAGLVVRLKGGDPFVFGRGGEEALALAAEGIPFEVVPGVTAGIAAPAYAGIPVTHRGLSGSVSLITGHLTGDDGGVALDRLHLEGTLVFYMASATLEKIADELIRLGRDPNTPAAVIESGTLGMQRTFSGLLPAIAAIARENDVRSPMLLVVGEVASLRDELAWFEDRPLYNRRVAVTHAKTSGDELVSGLRERGAEVFEFPTVEIAPATDNAALDLNGIDWIVLTSVNGVDVLFERLAASDRDARALHGIRLCAVGVKTATALGRRFIRPDATPEHYEAEPVVQLLESVGGPMRGKRILLPRADIARAALRDELRGRGAEVIELHAYRAGVPRDSSEHADALMAFAPHYVTFTSAAAARNIAVMLGPERLERLRAGTHFAAIGPVAAQGVRDIGLTVDIEPGVHRAADLVAAIVAWDAIREG